MCGITSKVSGDDRWAWVTRFEPRILLMPADRWGPSQNEKMASAVVAIAGKAIKGREEGSKSSGEGGKREREGAQSATSDPQKKLHIFSLGGR